MYYFFWGGNDRIIVRGSINFFLYEFKISLSLELMCGVRRIFNRLKYTQMSKVLNTLYIEFRNRT